MQSGVLATLRFFFAFFRVNERNRDVSPTIAIWRQILTTTCQSPTSVDFGDWSLARVSLQSERFQFRAQYTNLPVQVFHDHLHKLSIGIRTAKIDSLLSVALSSKQRFQL